jgi:hydrogenase maturation protease
LSPEGTAPDTVVFGVGDPCRGDDAVGPLVAGELRRIAGPGASWIRTEEPSGLIDAVASHRAVIVVDACTSRAPAGTIRITDEIPQERDLLSSHGISVSSALGIASALGKLNARVRFVLVTGKSFGLGDEPSPEVLAAVPEAVVKIIAERSVLAKHDGN